MFQDDKLYFTSDPALLALAPPSTLAHFRCESRGPAYVKIGARVAYRGADLNEWIASCTVQPKVI